LSVRGSENGCWVEKWRALYPYVQRLLVDGDCFTLHKVLLLYVSFFTSTEVLVLQININLIVQVDNNGVFKSVFVVHYAAVAVVREHGRPVCSTDFGHFKHDYFDGLNATGSCTRIFVRLILCLCFLLNIRIPHRVVPDGKWKAVGNLDCYFC
jgi:hypothetical protein